MLIVEAGVFWRRVAKRFDKRVNDALVKGYAFNQFTFPVNFERGFWPSPRIIMWTRLDEPK